jgi:hypothetical protein
MTREIATMQAMNQRRKKGPRVIKATGEVKRSIRERMNTQERNRYLCQRRAWYWMKPDRMKKSMFTNKMFRIPKMYQILLDCKTKLPR